MIELSSWIEFLLYRRQWKKKNRKLFLRNALLNLSLCDQFVKLPFIMYQPHQSADRKTLLHSSNNFFNRYTKMKPIEWNGLHYSMTSYLCNIWFYYLTNTVRLFLFPTQKIHIQQKYDMNQQNTQTQKKATMQKLGHLNRQTVLIFSLFHISYASFYFTTNTWQRL